MRRITTRSGYVKFLRLGTLEFGEQSRWNRAPRSRGMWAFPYPFFDPYLAFHKYKDLMPKRLQAPDADYQEISDWIDKVGKKVLPIREFWYRGAVFTHFLDNGSIGSSGIAMVTDEDDRTDWTAMDVTRLAEFIRRSGAVTVFERYGENNEKLARYNSSVDHLEVFIAPGMGKILHNAPGGVR